MIRLNRPVSDDEPLDLRYRNYLYDVAQDENFDITTVENWHE